MSDKIITIGRLGAAYGIQGWLHITSFTDPTDNIFEYRKDWLIKTNNQWRPIKITNHKSHGNAFIVKLPECNDRDTAMQFKGTEIGVKRSALPETNANEYYWDDLIGLTVYTISGESIGTVDYLFETGSNDVIVTKGEKQHFIPYTDDAIKQVDLEKQAIIIDWELI